MNTKFNDLELRVIGCLIEKSITTPDQYPLSLNSLTNACNQKSNREPVMSLSENDVQNTIDSLTDKNVVLKDFATSSRVAKYVHRFCNTEFGDLQFSEQELGIICVLMLRGAQTPGELRTRTNRLCQFNNVSETEQVLDELVRHTQGPFVVKLGREPGRRESRYQHCFYENEPKAITEPEATQVNESSLPQSRADSLEARVQMLERELEIIKSKLTDL